MSIAKWAAFRELEGMSARLNRLFGHTTVSGANAEAAKGATTFDWSPTVDIAETSEEFQIKAELPEVKKEDVKVSVDHGLLRLQGERKPEPDDKSKKFHRVERGYGSFLRTFTLPDNVDQDQVRAEFKDGVLNVRLPKTDNTTSKAIDIMSD